MQVHQGARTLKVRCCTQRKISLMVVEDEVDWHALVAIDKSRTRGIEQVLT